MSSNARASKAQSPHVDILGRSIPQWCSAYDVSRATFYNLEKNGQAPATIKLGRRRIITNAASQAWEAAMAKLSAK